MLPFLVLFSCSTKQPLPEQTPVLSEGPSVLDRTLDSHAVYASQLWSQSLQSARKMDRAIQTFTTNPSEETLSKAKSAWKEARQHYSQTEALRFQNGPIDNSETGVEHFLNAWPLDEAYIDYTQDDAASGIINQPDSYPEITEELLLSLNEKGGEENISLGYHAIEFLLWGQDISVEGPGNRPLTDYTEHPNAQRRIQYLQISSRLLLTHLLKVESAWNGEYLTQYRAMDNTQRLKGIWTGMAMLAGDEMAGERLAVPYETQDQEDEQSCFSDTTLQDFKNNLIGIANIYAGSDRNSFANLLEQADPQMHNDLLNALSEAFTALLNIPEPFDQSLQSEEARPSIEHAITALEDLSDTLTKAAKVLGVDVQLEGG